MKQTMFITSKTSSTENSEKITSFFEFWPTWVMYFPVILQWLVLAIKYRSLTLSLLANPRLTLSGMVGVSKSELMNQAKGKCHKAILPWNKYVVSIEMQLARFYPTTD